MDLQFYIDKATDPSQVPMLREQYFDAHGGAIACDGCGLRRDLALAFKCLYCGVWFCFNCAEIHFGKTVADYHKEKKCHA